MLFPKPNVQYYTLLLNRGVSKKRIHGIVLRRLKCYGTNGQ